ncbi:bifunctional diaminohydroxyphosphoribosylaminopyrimidine deaminase/5-amino-6-(5-phosphoribosylamino)uracil reductase RibD [Williamsia herbipolensis]|uniref:Riboflavin biosynthesis protein RibD n=1 Tax=Williamsia herbipolensis TaxID=1603258 RepID=A0AAU4K3F4_9NOCA|nr:bifunctional diaminohydroxyphosphoribosylaminopyrimidine deaminase/5-amino-6-(5-phosphoribosylamino)uracil reductase RibD [Williamsia herbipolensis]
MTSERVATDEAAMRAAIDASQSARGISTPNPPVGAVVVDRAGVVVGVGSTAPAGGPHAEVVALAAAGDRARGATAVVTLEPCDHTGRTGPCTAALIAAGITRVVYAVSDPNPVAAGGAATLRAAGIEVVGGVLADDVAADPLRAWLFRLRTGRPLVTAKFAATLDGRIAAPDGTSRWITGDVARERVHRDRARLDAIVVGSGTVATDDPALTARHADGSLRGHQPTRIVLGRRPLPDGARILGPEAPTRHVASHDPAEAVAAAGDALSLLVEGGPTVLGAFLAAGLVDRVQAYLAPTVLGAGAAAVLDASVATLAQAHRFTRESVEILGDDLLITLAPTV